MISCGGTSAPDSAQTGERELHATGTSQSMARNDLAPVCFLDQLGDIRRPASNQPVRVFAAKDIVFSGWAVDDAAKRAAAGVDVVVDGTPLRAQYGAPRPDVEEAYKNPEYHASGFT